MRKKPIVWSVAGTDPSGGAGSQADLQTMSALGVHGCSVITAVLAQTAAGVARIEYLSREIVAAQLQGLSTQMPPAAIKVGMLGTCDTIQAVAQTLSELNVFTVCDPVLASTSGTRLITEAAQRELVERLFPLIDLLTPNRPEASLLTGLSTETRDEVEKTAGVLLKSGIASVLIKGGHAEDGSCRDYWTNGSEKVWFTSPRLPGTATHGSGCVLSSAIAARCAQGDVLLDAIAYAKAYVSRGIREGSGYGSLSHTTLPDLTTDMPERS